MASRRGYRPRRDLDPAHSQGCPRPRAGMETARLGEPVVGRHGAAACPPRPARREGVPEGRRESSDPCQPQRRDRRGPQPDRQVHHDLPRRRRAGRPAGRRSGRGDPRAQGSTGAFRSAPPTGQPGPLPLWRVRRDVHSNPDRRNHAGGADTNGRTSPRRTVDCLPATPMGLRPARSPLASSRFARHPRE